MICRRLPRKRAIQSSQVCGSFFTQRDAKMTRIEVTRSSSVRELRQWLSDFGEENRTHFEKGQVKAGATTSVRHRIQSLERSHTRLSNDSSSSSSLSCSTEHKTTTITRDVARPIFRKLDSSTSEQKEAEMKRLEVKESEDEKHDEGFLRNGDEDQSKGNRSYQPDEDLPMDLPRDLATNQSLPSLLDQDEDDYTRSTEHKGVSLYHPSLEIAKDEFRIVSISKLLDPPEPKRILDQVPAGWHPNVTQLFPDEQSQESKTVDQVSVHSDGLIVANETASEISLSRFTDPGVSSMVLRPKPNNQVRALSFRNKLPLLLCKSAKEEEKTIPKEAESSHGDSSSTSCTSPDSIDIRLGSIFGEEIKRQDAATSAVSLGIHKWEGKPLEGQRNKPTSMSTVRRRQEELQRKWEANKPVTHTKKVTWRASHGRYRKKVVLDYP